MKEDDKKRCKQVCAGLSLSVASSASTYITGFGLSYLPLYGYAIGCALIHDAFCSSDADYKPKPKLFVNQDKPTIPEMSRGALKQ